MDKFRLDALIAPTDGPAWTTDPVNGDHYAGGCSTPAAVAGYPHVTVPAGFIFGLPVGVSFFGRAFSEPVLIRLAYAFEQATKHRRPPKFLEDRGSGRLSNNKVRRTGGRMKSTLNSGRSALHVNICIRTSQEVPTAIEVLITVEFHGSKPPLGVPPAARDRLLTEGQWA